MTSGARWAGQAGGTRVKHERERRQFSVLCHRGWCDNGFRDRDVAALAGWATGQKMPAYHGPARYCHMPFVCECECHDERKAQMGAQITAHTEATYSQRQGFGQDHAVLDKPLATSRFQRKAGEALCRPGLVTWGPSPRGNGRVNCPDCLARAQRYGVRLP